MNTRLTNECLFHLWRIKEKLRARFQTGATDLQRLRRGQRSQWRRPSHQMICSCGFLARQTWHPSVQADRQWRWEGTPKPGNSWFHPQGCISGYIDHESGIPRSTKITLTAQMHKWSRHGVKLEVIEWNCVWSWEAQCNWVQSNPCDGKCDIPDDHEV